MSNREPTRLHRAENLSHRPLHPSEGGAPRLEVVEPEKENQRNQATSNPRPTRVDPVPVTVPVNGSSKGPEKSFGSSVLFGS